MLSTCDGLGRAIPDAAPGRCPRGERKIAAHFASSSAEGQRHDRGLRTPWAVVPPAGRGALAPRAPRSILGPWEPQSRAGTTRMTSTWLSMRLRTSSSSTTQATSTPWREARPSTESYDCGEKREQYQQIPSLREIVLLAHDQRRIEVHRREVEGWSVHQVGPGESIALDSIGCRLEVDSLYERAGAQQRRNPSASRRLPRLVRQATEMVNG